ncbi:hypothetical protein U5A82_21275 [Sphingobium sp. CR2-8]|uniref:hypothetical protein n=1 Tax=Sphingobium sp. CR2-8 TaxID=1306534 RepID=UPI002DB97E81|nr:hypothetical protein [Sphingobium sp. CR2-8]MEC3912909.1 hypothetical protein [Sphingobium sp. CR2-8]
MGDRLVQRRSGVVPSGEAAYMEGIPNRQTVFAILFQKFLDVGRYSLCMIDRISGKTGA